jgi:hypothetical protein
MADQQWFPGFEGEDEKSKPQPAKPAPAAPSAKPAFDPFAGVPVDTKAAPSAPVPAPAAARPAAAPARPAPPAPVADQGDADIKPGARKDLWICPHCGAGNKPDRTTCRSCGKSPADPVVVPLHKRPVVLVGVAGVVLAAIVALFVLGGTDLSLREPGPDGVDARPRIAGSASGAYEVDAVTRFDAQRQISVSGRVVAMRDGRGLRWIALALAPAATADGFAELKPAESDGRWSLEGGVILAVVGDRRIDAKAGDWLSLTGETGDLVKDGQLMREAEGAIPVRPDAVRVAKP